MKNWNRLLIGLVWMVTWQVSFSQCSSLYTTPEFPIATHPSDGHTQSWGANLFTPTQLGTTPASFTGIQVYVDNSFGPTTYASQQVWLRHTAVSNYPNAQYPTTTGFTQCFSGTYSFPMSGLYTIPFNISPFAYNGSSNVEILFENRSNVYRANEPWFRRTPSYGAAVYRSKWNGNFGFGGFPGTASNGSAVRLTYTLSLTAMGGSGCGAMLPVAFPSFSALPEGKKVLCSWDVEESSVQPLILERSNGDAEFLELASFEAALGHVDWVDHHPNPGIGIYRLRQVDVNGTDQISSMVVVDMSHSNELMVQAFPGESGIELLLNSPDDREVEIQVMDVQGRILMAENEAITSGQNQVLLPMSATRGILILKVISADGIVLKKMIY